MKLHTLILGTLSFCLLWFLGWEAWGIFDARRNAPDVFATYETGDGVGWADLTARQQDLVLLVEDPKFWTHHGVDVETPGAGRQTITQFLASRLFVEKFMPGFLDVEASLAALMVIDPLVSKETQLNAYLELADFGEVEGFDEASRVFFRQPVSDLNEQNFIRLIAVLLDPERYQPGLEANTLRMARIIRLARGACAPVDNRDVEYRDC